MTFIYPGGDAQYTTNLGLATFGMDEVLAENMILIDAAVGTGSSSIKVNGLVVANPNFNNTTPTAPTGSPNITWQDSGSSVSAYVNLSDVPSLNIGDGKSSIVFGTTAGSITITDKAGSHITLNGTGAVSLIATQVVSIISDLGSAINLNTSGGFTLTSAGSTEINVNTGSDALLLIAGTGGVLVTDPAGSVWNSATGGSQGAGTINATGLFINGVAVSAGGGSGTVTSFSAGSLSPIFTSSVANPTTTPALTFSLSNAAQNAVLAGPATGGTGAVTYRLLQTSDIPSLSSIYLPLTGGALSGNLTLGSTVTDGSASVGTNGQLLSSTATGVKWINASSVGVTWSNLTSASANLILNNAGFTTTFQQTSAVDWEWANVTPTITGAATTVALSTTTAPVNAGGNSWTYTLAASESGAGSNAWAGASVTIAGYTSTATGNNGTSLAVTASTTTTITVTNATGTTANTGTPTVISTAVSNSPILQLAGTVNTGTAGALVSTPDVWSIENVIGSVAPNPTSTLTFSHSGTSGIAAVAVPAGTLATAGAYGLTFSGTSIGFNATGTTLSILTSSGYPNLRFYNGATEVGDLSTATSSGVNLVTLESDVAPATVVIAGQIKTTLAQPCVILGGNSGNSGNYTGTTSGSQIGVSMGMGSTGGTGALSYAPTAATGTVTTSFIAVQINPLINATGGATYTGQYTGLKIAAVETSLNSMTGRLIDAYAGSTGVTSEFYVTNAGLCNAAGGFSSGGTAGVSVGPFTVVSSITTVGGIVTALSGTSDERLKDSAPYEGGLPEILAITPVKYKWNEAGQKHTGLDGSKEFVGFLAQDVQKAIPEAITATEGAEKYLSFDDRPVIAALVNAVKTLTARIEQLERGK